MKKWFKTQNEEIDETKETAEENSEEKEPKKFTIPKPVKYGAAAIGLALGAIGLSRIFGGGSDFVDADWDDESEEGSDSETANSETDTTSAETAE